MFSKYNHIYTIFNEGSPEEVKVLMAVIGKNYIFKDSDEADKKALLLTVGERFLFKDSLVTFDLKAPYNFIEAMYTSDSSNMCSVREKWDVVQTWFWENISAAQSASTIPLLKSKS